MALHVAAFGQVTINRDALIKYETLAVPAILLVGHFGEIRQNASLQVVDLLESEFKHQGRRLFAANTTALMLVLSELKAV